MILQAIPIYSLREVTDGGKTFDRTKNLSNNAGASSFPQVAASGNNVYVTWDDNTPGNLDILFKRSTDGGKTFDRTKNLSNNAGASFQPEITASGNNVYVTWGDSTPGNFDILFKRSTDGGKTLDSTKNLSNNAGASFFPRIASSWNNVYVVWTDSTPGNFDILFKRSTDGGHDFDRTKNLSNNAGDSNEPRIDSSWNNVYVVWTDTTPGQFDILFKRSTDGGHDFDRTKNLSNNAGTSTNSQIAASWNNVYIAWGDTTPGQFDILFKRSTDGGHDFDKTKNLSNNAAGSSFIQDISTSGNNVNVVWQDGTPGNFDIFFKRSTDGGHDFDKTKNLSNNAGASSFPQIEASGNNVYVTWFDDTPGNFDVFFKRGTQWNTM